MWTWLLGGGSASHKAHGRLSGFLSGAGSVKRDFTLANMQHLHLQLVKYPDLPDAEIVEVLRVLSEFLIYSDQNRSDSPNSPQMLESIAFEATTASAGVFFDYFCEKNILGLLVELGESKPSVAVQIQLLQTLSLLVQNIATRTSLYYILSNNYVNKLLECPFAYDTDDDVRDWYVTLLKALSLRLNEDTVQFFFNTSNQSFPLYVQALRFGRCSETMIKVAVKTLMLNVLRVQDERVRRFLLEYQDMAYFQDIVEYANEMALKIQGLMNIWTPTATVAMTDKLEEAVDSYIDHCFYLQDILDVNLPELCYRVGEAIYSRHVRDFLAVSILPNCHLPPQRVSTRLALYLLTRLLGILEHAPLVNAISFLLLSPDAHLGCDYSTVALGAGARRRSVRTVKKSKGKSKKKKRKSLAASGFKFLAHSAGECSTPLCYLQTRYSHGEWPTDEVKAFQSKESNWFRQSLLTLTESGDELLSSTSLLVVLAVMNSSAIDHSLLREWDLLPHRLRHHHHHGVKSTPVREADEATVESSAESSSTSHDDDESIDEGPAEGDETTAKADHWMVEGLLRILHRCTDVRLLTTQLAVRTILDLMWDGHTDGVASNSPSLTSDHLEMLQAIHSVSTHQVMQSMRGAMADVDLFIYVLEDEFLDFGKTKFPVALNLKSSSPYEFLVPLSMPGKTLAERKATLAIRSPVNEMELCRKSMRVFLTLRRMRDLVDVNYADDKFDELTAFRHPHTEALAAVRPSRTTNNVTEAVDLEGMVFLKCMWREQRFLPTPAKLLMVLNPEALAFVEKDDQHRTKDKEYGFVRLFAPIHRAYATIDAKDELVLHFTISSPGPVEGCRSYHKSKTKDSQVDSLKRWHVSVLFENSEDCRQAKAHVDLSRAEVRAHKLLKIEESLIAHVQITASNAALRESEQRDSTLTNEDGES